MGIGCGPGANNACYCRTDFASSASSYLTSCISDGCSRASGNIDSEINTALAIYDGYCARARVEGVTSTEAATDTTAVEASAGPKTMSPSAARSTGASAAVATKSHDSQDASSSASPTLNKSNGLSKSDAIALGVGLGVGIPSLLIAMTTCCFQMRKRRRRSSNIQESDRVMLTRY